MFKFNKSLGQVSRLLLVLAIVVFVAVIITFLIMKMAEKPSSPGKPTTPSTPLPVFEQTLENIRFVYESALDKGDTLKASEVTDIKSTNAKDLKISNPGAKFIKVTIGAQNIGLVNTIKGAWNIENIIDSKGRNFVPLGSMTNPWLPKPNLCGELLKPAFDPTPCTKIYEVSKESTGFKIRIEAGKNNKPISSGSNNSFLLDLIVK